MGRGVNMQWQMAMLNSRKASISAAVGEAEATPLVVASFLDLISW